MRDLLQQIVFELIDQVQPIEPSCTSNPAQLAIAATNDKFETNAHKSCRPYRRSVRARRSLCAIKLQVPGGHSIGTIVRYFDPDTFNDIEKTSRVGSFLSKIYERHFKGYELNSDIIVSANNLIEKLHGDAHIMSLSGILTCDMP